MTEFNSDQLKVQLLGLQTQVKYLEELISAQDDRSLVREQRIQYLTQRLTDVEQALSDSETIQPSNDSGFLSALVGMTNFDPEKEALQQKIEQLEAKLTEERKIFSSLSDSYDQLMLRIKKTSEDFHAYSEDVEKEFGKVQESVSRCEQLEGQVQVLINEKREFETRYHLLQKTLIQQNLEQDKLNEQVRRLIETKNYLETKLKALQEAYNDLETKYKSESVALPTLIHTVELINTKAIREYKIQKEMNEGLREELENQIRINREQSKLIKTLESETQKIKQRITKGEHNPGFLETFRYKVIDHILRNLPDVSGYLCLHDDIRRLDWDDFMDKITQ